MKYPIQAPRVWMTMRREVVQRTREIASLSSVSAPRDPTTIIAPRIELRMMSRSAGTRSRALFSTYNTATARAAPMSISRPASPPVRHPNLRALSAIGEVSVL